MSNDDQVPHMRASTSSSAELPKNFDAEDITAKGDNAKRGAEGPVYVNNLVRQAIEETIDSNRQLQGAQVSKSKAPVSFEGVKTSQKRQYGDVDAGPSPTLSLPSKVTTPKPITLSVELLETDSAFKDTSVAHKIFEKMLPPADKEMMNGPSFANISSSVHQAFLTWAHMMKGEEYIKQIERKSSEYRDRALGLDKDLKLAEAEKKKAKVEAGELQLKVKHLNEELAKAEVQKAEAVQTALANFRGTPEFITAVEKCAQRAIAACINEVQRIHPEMDLSMISFVDPKTAGDNYDDSKDGNGEGK